MHAIVCIKQVPDSSEMKINPDTGTLVRTGVPSIINPYDVPALEAALRLKDEFGGKVTVISMGPPFFEQSMRKAVALGADDTILLSDRRMAGADTYATSYALALGIQKVAEEEPFDIILCGRQTIDGDTAQVGPGIAARLGLPVLTYVMNIREVDFDNRELVVERKLEQARQVIKSKLPAVLTCEKELNEVRYASLPNLLRAHRHELTVWSGDELGAEQGRLGLRGSPTIVARSITPPEQEREGFIVDDPAADPAQAARELVDRLFEEEQFRYVLEDQE